MDLLEVEISADGEYSVNNRRLDANDRETLRRVIEEVAAGDTSLPFVITADANAPHQYVVRVMDVAGSLGFTGLSISTERTPEGDGN